MSEETVNNIESAADDEGKVEDIGVSKALMGIHLDVKVVLGNAVMTMAQLMKMGRGTVIGLDRSVGAPVDIMVADRVIARGEIMIYDDTQQIGVTLTEIVSKEIE